MINDVEYLLYACWSFLCLFKEMLIQFLCSFTNWIICFLAIDFLYILDVTSLSNIHLVNIFFFSVGYLLILLIISFV